MAVKLKDPQAVLDFGVNWAKWLGDDAIATSEWTVPDGITEDSTDHEDGITTIWLSGGTAGSTYRLTNRITTLGGRTDDRTFTVRVQDR